ncbi:Protein of unknown function [Vibrio xiamenensis]|uniref:DUF2500 domain-containing protein n=2 Tax=Vibrio xiamenensis TaxID=861298 RepID=A0A1G8G2V0_9VIBR|nr:Protein of unknown function [Vibrio xiamenensis]
MSLSTTMPLSIYLAIAMLIALAAWACSRLYQQHQQGRNAVEKTADITILDKQAIDSTCQNEQQEYWIWVKKGQFGPKREFQVGIHYFQALNPGDRGVLTYRGDKFVHFALKR